MLNSSNISSNIISCKITSGTRVCSRHFNEEDYQEPDKAGRRRLKRGAIPSKFDWSIEPKTRRKIIRQVERFSKCLTCSRGSGVKYCLERIVRTKQY